MALTRARVVSASPAFARAGRDGRSAPCSAASAMPQRSPPTWSKCARAIAEEKGEGERWDLKYAAGGLIDIEFIAQYLQLVHAAEHPDILDTSTARVLEKAGAARRAAGRGCRSAAPGGAALSGSDADPAAVPARRRSIRRPPAPGCCGCWRAPPTCRISPRSTRI